MSEFFLHSFNTLSHGFIGYIIPFLFVLTIVVFAVLWLIVKGVERFER